MKDSCITVMAMALLSGFFFFGRQGRREGKGHVSVTRETAGLGAAGVNKELPHKVGLALGIWGPGILEGERGEWGNKRNK